MLQSMVFIYECNYLYSYALSHRLIRISRKIILEFRVFVSVMNNRVSASMCMRFLHFYYALHFKVIVCDVHCLNLFLSLMKLISRTIVYDYDTPSCNRCVIWPLSDHLSKLSSQLQNRNLGRNQVIKLHAIVQFSFILIIT